MFSIISKGKYKKRINSKIKKKENIFSRKDKIVVDNNLFAAYFPQLFLVLRKKWGISEDEYRNELSKVTGGKLGAGKSKMLFWKSKTNKFFIKTMPKSEVDVLRKIMTKYYKYMIKNKRSFLPKFLGVYKEDGKYFLVQTNIAFKLDKPIIYDLKGSISHRFSYSSVKKDNNFGDSKVLTKFKTKIKNQLLKDSSFLAAHNLMDYSLLLAINNKPLECDDSLSEIRSKFVGPPPSAPVDVCIKFGIIDIWQDYNFSKFLESFYKSKTHYRSKKAETSAIAATPYKKRFDKMIQRIFA